jgi:hypothetical protein
MALLEREQALGSLAEYADQARRGEGRLALVAGEAGVGKSALLDRFAASLTGAGWYWGACDGLFTPRPLGAFVDIAGQLGAQLAGLYRAQAARDELFGALLNELAQPGGLRVIVVEDIHWADEATLDLLRFLARRIREMPVLIVATYREDELATSYPLRVALGELAVQRCTRRIELSPLSATAVETIAAGSGLDAAELYRVTGGNPFYVVEALHTGLDRVPQSARDAVLARAARLGPGASDALHLAALTGSVVEPWLLEQAAGATPEVVDELAGCGLLVADGAAWKRRSPGIAGRPSTPGCWPRCSTRAARTRPGWPSTPRRPATVPPRSITPRWPGARQPGWARTGRRRRSSSGRCALPRTSLRACSRPVTTPWRGNCR